MTVKALDASGAGTTAAVAEGIRYAAANGARVINMSLGGDQPDPRLQEAIAAAGAANVLVVCSAGNSGRNIDQQPSFPVSVPAPNLIGVAATAPNEGRSLSGFSNFGQLTVALAAPGERVLSASNDGTFTTMSGTSMAAPHVAGVAALMVSVRPDLPAVDLRAALLQNALPASLPVGSGYLYARGAVLAVSGTVDLGQGQRPAVRVLKAERSGRGSAAITRAQVAVEGATEAITDFHVRIDGRRVAVVRKRAIPFTVRVRGRSGARMQVQARNAGGKVLGAGTRRIRAVRRGKRNIHSGGDVRSGEATGAASSSARAGPGGAARRTTISFSGSSTALPIVADLAYFYRRSHPDAPRFSIVGGGTASGINDAARGIVSAGLASRAASSSDPPGLKFTSFALSGVCLVTNKANRVPGFSRAVVQELVAGRVTSWSQVPGATRTDAPAPAGLVAGTGARSVFTSTLVDAATTVAYRPRTFTTASQVRAYVLSSPAAWAYVDLLYTEGLQVVPFDGVPCTRATVLSGRYPATRPLSFVTRGRPAGATARFIRWVHTSATARRVIATRYVPTR
jgi:subtilisin family serine protease